MRLTQVLTFTVLTAGVLAACTVEMAPPRPLPPGPGACTQEFAPVCARRGNTLRTFSNACNARAAGFQIERRGECRAPPPITPRPPACTREFAPVCAVRGNRLRDFSNPCLARADGFTPIYRGQCR